MTNAAFPEEIVSLLRVHGFGVLATYGGEYPHTSLISLEFTPDYHSLIFSTLRETKKYANLLREARVSMLLDNRSSAGDTASLYALTVLGVAHEAEETAQPALRRQLLQRHPQLKDFLSLPQTALIHVTLEKIILVEGLRKIREFCVHTK
jgi:nitroimidazol reductase NimA-like FMN-containing flavoprotein (pyridoxamine 5'-phosphate oxidase superfamily)